MPVCIKANKWATNLIIVFQLTVWSFVGIMLLQKGVISLRGEAGTRSTAVDTQESIARRNEKESIEDSAVAEIPQRIVEHEAASRQRNGVLDNLEDATQKGPRSRMHAYPAAGTNGGGIPVKSSVIKKRTTIGHEQDTRDVRAIEAEKIHAVDRNDEEIRHEENVVGSNDRSYNVRKTLRLNSLKLKDTADATDIVRSDENRFFEEENANVPSNKTTDDVDSELALQRSRAGRIGTAVAIVMLAIGVVMLLLGPLIIIVRAIGDRRRTRQMLKSRCENDRPPTYEEAVLMDPVPRYSTLQLDAILESSGSS